MDDQTMKFSAEMFGYDPDLVSKFETSEYEPNFDEEPEYEYEGSDSDGSNWWAGL